MKGILSLPVLASVCIFPSTALFKSVPGGFEYTDLSLAMLYM